MDCIVEYYYPEDFRELSPNLFILDGFLGLIRDLKNFGIMTWRIRSGRADQKTVM
jgi:hypothetical protein